MSVWIWCSLGASVLRIGKKGGSGGGGGSTGGVGGGEKRQPRIMGVHCKVHSAHSAVVSSGKHSAIHWSAEQVA